MESLTLTLSGTSSILEAQYFPPIELLPNKNYSLGLVEFLSFNSIPNIDEGNNKFYIGNEVIKLQTGSYEIGAIEKYIQKILKERQVNIEISIKPNESTLKSEINSNAQVDFRPQDSIANLLGFDRRILPANSFHISDTPVNILKLNSIRVECNITTGAYINNKKVHTIHEFYPVADPGFKIIEIPTQVIYLPVCVKSIDKIQLRLVDQDGDLINFREEVITIRLHIKSS